MAGAFKESMVEAIQGFADEFDFSKLTNVTEDKICPRCAGELHPEKTANVTFFRCQGCDSLYDNIEDLADVDETVDGLIPEPLPDRAIAPYPLDFRPDNAPGVELQHLIEK